MSPSTALTSKSKRIFAVVKFANVYQGRHYKTTCPCTEFVDTQLFYLDCCDRPSMKIKNPIKEETYNKLKTNNFEHRQNNSIYRHNLSQQQDLKSILKTSTGIEVSALE